MKKLFLGITLLASGAAIFGAASSNTPIKYLSQKELANALDTILNQSNIKNKPLLKQAAETLETARFLNSEHDTAAALTLISTLNVLPDSSGVIEFSSPDLRSIHREGLSLYVIKGRLLEGQNPFAPMPTYIPSTPPVSMQTIARPQTTSGMAQPEKELLTRTFRLSKEKLVEGITKALSKKDLIGSLGKAMLAQNNYPAFEEKIREMLQNALNEANNGSVHDAENIIYNIENTIQNVTPRIKSQFLIPLLSIISNIKSGTPEKIV